jgi:hypothetical protein
LREVGKRIRFVRLSKWLIIVANRITAKIPPMYGTRMIRITIMI